MVFSGITWLFPFIVYLKIWELKTPMWLKLIGVVLTIEIAFKKGWRRLWLQCDSILLVQSFRDIDFVPWRIKNRWCNCIELTKQMYLVVGHVFREENTYVDLLACRTYAHN